VWVHRELQRPGVTLELLHLEYISAHPDGYRHTAF
jgi:transposase